MISLMAPTQKIDADDDAVLAVRKSFDAMITAWAERPAAIAAADRGRVMAVIRAIHLLLSSLLTSVVPAIGSCLML